MPARTQADARTPAIRQIQTLPVVAALCIGLFAFAFVAAPQSCEWGLTAYFWSGVAVLIVLLAAPFVLQSARPVPIRIYLALGYVALGALTWIGGLFAANVRIMCRLF